MLPVDVAYSLDSGRFTRTLAYPTTRDGKDGVIGAEDIAKAITNYVSLVDKMMKACVGGADAETLSDMYSADLETRQVIL